MPSNIINPDDWADILESIGSGHPSRARDRLMDRDRKLDAYFSSIDKNVYMPVVTQGANTITLDTALSYVEGFRIGPWIMLNIYLYCTGNGTAGVIKVTLPPQFPAVPSPSANAGRTIGSFTIAEFGTTTTWEGSAEVTAASAGLTVLGNYDNAGPMGLFGFNQAIVNHDIIKLSIQYQTIKPV